MFYAKEILSMQAKTDISLIYYVSTTNNRRITKTEINKIDINNTLVSVLDQAYALRLYGFILRGVSKVYMLKMKYYENEVAGLLNMLKVRIIKKKEVKKSIQIFSSEESEDIYDGGVANESRMNFKNNYISNYDLNNYDDINYESVPSIKENKVIIDDEIELNSEQCIKRVKKQPQSYNFISIREYPVFKLLETKKNYSQSDKQSYIQENQQSYIQENQQSENKDSVEIYRNRSSSNVPSQILSENHNIDLLSMGDSLSESYQYCDSSTSKIRLLDLIGEEACFSEIAYGNRQCKANMFYELLDLLSKNVIEAKQELPESEIYISRN